MDRLVHGINGKMRLLNGRGKGGIRMKKSLALFFVLMILMCGRCGFPIPAGEEYYTTEQSYDNYFPHQERTGTLCRRCHRILDSVQGQGYRERIA